MILSSTHLGPAECEAGPSPDVGERPSQDEAHPGQDAVGGDPVHAGTGQGEGRPAERIRDLRVAALAAVVDGLDGRHGRNHLICELLQRLR